MSKIVPCLWFDSQAEDAANFYVSVFRDCGQKAAITDRMQYVESSHKPKGSLLSITFTLSDLEFIAINGGPHFTHSPAISMFVKCADQIEVDKFWNKLLAGGGKPVQCGWLTDKFGVSWQIVPTELGEMLKDPDVARAARVTEAMLKMIKLDLIKLKQVYDGE